MGSFSWLKADKLTTTANVAYDTSFKFLIPKEFGGGVIKDIYQDYGYLGTKKRRRAKIRYVRVTCILEQRTDNRRTFL